MHFAAPVHVPESATSLMTTVLATGTADDAMMRRTETNFIIFHNVIEVAAYAEWPYTRRWPVGTARCCAVRALGCRLFRLENIGVDN